MVLLKVFRMIKNFNYSPSKPDFWLDVYGKVKSHDNQLGDSMNFNKIFIHPKYKSGEQYDDYDLAIVSFRKPLQELNGKIRPICIPETSKLNVGNRYFLNISLSRTVLWWKAVNDCRVGNRKFDIPSIPS